MNGMVRNSDIELLHELVAIESVSGLEREAVSYLVEQMEMRGFRSFADNAGNAIGIRGNLESAEHTLVLLGHIDTVPGKIPVRLEDGQLYGRGSVDAKGPLAAFVLAVERIDVPEHIAVIVVGAVEEESATSKGARYVLERYCPSACVIGEPSGWNGITIGYKGRLLANAIFRGGIGHTAGEAQTIADVAVDWWTRVKSGIADFNEGKERLFDQVLPSLRHIYTDSDGLMEWAEMKLGFRLPPDFACPWLEGLLENAGSEAQLSFFGHERAYSAERHSQLARAFARSLLSRGTRPVWKQKTGTSDMNVVGPVWNCQMLAYGPGDSALDHSSNEHIDIEEFSLGIDVLQSALQVFVIDLNGGGLKRP